MTAAGTPVHELRRVSLGVAVAFALVVVLGVLLKRVWAPDGSTAFDLEVTRWFMDHRAPTWNDAMRIVTWLGSGAVVISVAVVVVVALLVSSRRRVGFFVVLAVGGASLRSVLTKQVVSRERPPVGIQLQHPHGSAFPSGHSTQAAATYLALAIVVTVLSQSRVFHAVAWTAATLIVLLVGMSRVYLGVHWATDVLGGWLVGSVWVTGLAHTLAPFTTTSAQTTLDLLATDRKRAGAYARCSGHGTRGPHARRIRTAACSERHFSRSPARCCDPAAGSGRSDAGVGHGDETRRRCGELPLAELVVEQLELRGDRVPPRGSGEEARVELLAGGARDEAPWRGLVGELPAIFGGEAHAVFVVGQRGVGGEAVEDQHVAGLIVGGDPTLG
jgi:membrane-associated phospholipid phosphatase